MSSIGFLLSRTRQALTAPGQSSITNGGATATAELSEKFGGAGLRTGISSFGAWMVGVSGVIGSMAWLMHGPMIARSGPLAAIVAWVIAGALSLPTALILMELSSMFPSAGGPYVYKYYALKRLIPGAGELVGFLTGWLFWVAIIEGLACMANGLVNLLSTSFWGSSNGSPLWFGPVVILLLFGITTSLNLLSVKNASVLNNILSVMKMAMAVGCTALVFWSGHWSAANVLQISNFSGSSNLAANVSSVLMLALAGFGFMEMAGCTAAETVDAERSIPRAMILTLFTVTVIYVAMSFCVGASCSYVLSADKSTIVVAGTKIGASCPALVALIAGPFWGRLFTACVVTSIASCSFTAIMGVARISYSMAITKLFPRQFAQLHPRTGVPTLGLQFQFWIVCTIGIIANICARTGIFTDAYSFLGEVFGFMYAFVAMLYGICVVSLRYTDPDMKRPFRIGRRGNVLVWVIAAITVSIWGYAAFGCVSVVHQLSGLFILLCGVPVYYRYRRLNTAS